MIRNSLVKRGLVAGFLAGTTVALWFLVVDLVAAFPLRTPAFLARVLFGLDDVELAILPIAAYTLLHYLVFIGLGLLLAHLFVRLHPRAHLPLGLVVGVLLFDLLFYSSVIITGVNVLEALGWPVVLVGNLIAGAVLLEYLRISAPVPGLGWRSFLDEHRILRQGLIAGLLGAGAVALSFLVIDLVFQHALFTPAALGSAILHGASGPTEIQIDASTVLSYTLLHLVVFLVIGLVTAALIAQVEGHPALLHGIILAFVSFEALFIGLATIGGAWVLDSIGWWNVMLGNIVGTLTMIGYLGGKHPALWRILAGGPLATPV
jgi:hypothetical protein